MSGITIINAVLTALSILLLTPIAVFSIECLAAVLPWKRRSRVALSWTGDSKKPRAVVLIPAHNEQDVIEQTLEAVLAAPARARVLVVADNCDDRTAELAAQAGAEVVVRSDPERRGKGYALQWGIEHLRNNPPEVVVILDADCQPCPHTIDTLTELAWNAQRPVQALNLMDRNPADGPFQSISLLGNRFTNMIRPLGLSRLGLPCRLMGTGMAIPWRLLENVSLAGGNLVEDMQLGIDLALQGHLPLFCPEARVASVLPPANEAFVSQRTRWDHGHLRTAAVQIPRLLLEAVRRRRWPLLGIALDLSIPPLTLLVALWLVAAILAGAAWWFGASWTPLALLAGGGISLAAVLGLGWAVFCRRQVPLRAFAAAPLYVFRKMPIYARLLFHRQQSWVRTDRAATNHRPFATSRTRSRMRK